MDSKVNWRNGSTPKLVRKVEILARKTKVAINAPKHANATITGAAAEGVIGEHRYQEQGTKQHPLQKYQSNESRHRESRQIVLTAMMLMRESLLKVNNQLSQRKRERLVDLNIQLTQRMEENGSTMKESGSRIEYRLVGA